MVRVRLSVKARVMARVRLKVRVGVMVWVRVGFKSNIFHLNLTKCKC